MTGWDDFMQLYTPTGEPKARDGLPTWHMGQKPALQVDPACPVCGRATHWDIVQVLGDTPGIPGSPAQGSGVMYRCGLCGAEAIYRERELTDAELADRNARLLRGVGPG